MKKVFKVIAGFILIMVCTKSFGQTTYFRSICQGDTVMYWGNVYSQTGTYTNGTELLYLQVDVLPPTNLVVPGIMLCSPQDSLFATCNYNSTADAYWYVGRLPAGVVFQIPLGSGFHPATTGTYYAVVTNGCGSDSTTVVVSNCPPQQTIYNTICSGDSMFFDNQWLTQAGTYTDTSGIVDTVLHLTLNHAPDTTIIFSSGSLCNATLSAISGNILDTTLATTQHVWQLNGNTVGTNSTRLQWQAPIPL